jgi:hypothetical protein
MFIHRNLSATIIILFVVLVLSAANYRGAYAQSRTILVPSATPNNSSVVVLSNPQTPSNPTVLNINPPRANPNTQAEASIAASTPRPPVTPPEGQQQTADLRNPPFIKCDPVPSSSTYGILATYTIEATASLGKLADNPNDVNVTIFNDLKSGTLSGKVLNPDGKIISNLDIKRISTTCSSTTSSVPRFAPKGAINDADIAAQINPPTKSCQSQFTAATYTITNVPLKQIATHGHQHITLKIFSDLNAGHITGRLLTDGDPLVKFGNNRGVNTMVNFKNVAVTTNCSLEPTFNSG